MRTRVLIIVLFAITIFLQPLWTEQAFALCAADVNYDYVLKESELAFTGTVTRLDNYDGPQKVTFLVHDVIKGKVDTPKFILENHNMMFLENDTVMSSSVDVDYKVGKSYKVYVINGDADRCSTKMIAPPDGYVWEPGPEDGNYYSDEYEKPLRQYQDANERESYRDALDDGSITLSTEPSKLTDAELDAVLDGLYSHGLDHTELPIASIAIDYKRGIIVLWTPDLTIGNKVQELIGNVPFVLLYEEAPARWEHDGPEPEPPDDSPTQMQMLEEYCKTGIRHPDMIGIPQCIKEPQPSDFRDSGDNTSLLYAYSGLGLVGIVVGFFAIKKWGNRR